MTKKAILLLVEGFEEVEAITPIDYLRRANVEVTVAAIGTSLTVRGSRGLTVVADTTLPDLIKRNEAKAEIWDAIVLPGGNPGAPNLAASTEAAALVREMTAAGKLICAICAAPALVLAPMGLLAGKTFTCFPGFEEKVQGGHWSQERVVTDGQLITSRAAGTTGDFSIAIIKTLVSEAEGDRVAKAVLL